MTEQKNLFSQEAEEALIGALLINPGIIDEINLEPDDLYIDRHKWVFRAVRALWAKKIEPDLVTLTDVFARDNVLVEMGGPAWLTGLMLVTPSSSRAHNYARVVRDYARRRQMVAIANTLAGAAFDTDSNVDKPITDAIDSLGKSGTTNRGARLIAEYVAELRIDVADRIANPRDVWGIPMGFTDIDALTGGLQPGELFYLAGAPGIGKSKLMLNMAVNIGAAGYPGVIFSLEMPWITMLQRAVSLAGKVPTRLLKSGNLTGADYEAYQRGADEVEAMPIYLSDDPTMSLTGLRSELSRLKARHGIQWFALDYLLLLDGYEKLNDTERSAKLSIGVKRIARDLGIPGITVNSVTKDGMDEEGIPTSKNMRGSGSVVHDADLIAFLTKHPQMNTLVKLVFTKTRDVEGGEKSIDLFQHKEYPGFGNVKHEKTNLNGANNGRSR